MSYVQWMRQEDLNMASWGHAPSWEMLLENDPQFFHLASHIELRLTLQGVL